MTGGALWGRARVAATLGVLDITDVAEGCALEAATPDSLDITDVAGLGGLGLLAGVTT